ncbi:MAG: Soluble lytic murein transglycosylase precursor [Actinobacteria bacterium ADurb.Bin444]|nr:MAG: Soluble lytic murein transglycosylase precursor [Actinobacteria bacterium ADurb.Bin444]
MGAVGLMQLMPETAEWIAGRDDWKGPPQPDLRAVGDNLALGSYYLRFLRDMFDDDLVASLAAYNAGHGTVGRWLEDLRREGSGAGTLEPESIPYSDTRDFVRRVLEYRDLYARIYPDL